VRELGQVEGYKKLRHPALTQQGKKLVMRLMINDAVRMVVEGYVKTMRVAQISGNGQVFFTPHNEANVDARNRDKANEFAYISKTPSSLHKTLARKVTINELGKVIDNGFLG
jgi:CRISPR-associated endonuclease Csn1